MSENPPPKLPVLTGPCQGRTTASLEASKEGVGERYRHEVLAVVLQVRGERLHILLWQRAQEPFANDWALPGGHLAIRERLGASMARHLADKVELTDVAHLEQLETRSDIDRDPRERTIATAYLALVATESDPVLPPDTRWHPINELPSVAFDHASIAMSGRDRLRAKLTYTNVGFALAPESFSIAQLRHIYSACLGHLVSATNLQRVLLRRGVIEATDGVAPPSAVGGRPATLYRFSQRMLVVTDLFAAFRPPHASDVE